MSEPREQIPTYLLDELGPEEAAEFERRLRDDPALRAEVDRLRIVVERMEGLPAEGWDPPEPPALEMPVDATTGAEAASSGEEAAPTARRRRLHLPALTLRPALAGLLATALVAIGLGAGLAIGGGDSGTAPTGGPELVLGRYDDGPAGATGDVRLAEGGDRATLQVKGLDPSGAGRFYELWLLDANGQMVALGSFRVGEDGRAQVQLPIPVAPTTYTYFDVSLQKDDGDPAHSGISVLRGPTASS